jgi:beta-glucosidase
MKVSRVLSGVILVGCLFLLLVSLGCTKKQAEYPFLNPRLTVEERVDDLIGRMTLEEKISQMRYDAPAIDRLGIPEYNWWNECLHGVARAGVATVFPQAIGLGATWDTDLIHRVATATSDEARAKHHEFIRDGKRGIYQGLTFWSPNVNIFRDPRWGRGMETYGEDPYLTGRLGVAFVKGLQGTHHKYLKVVATPKHYAVHSGPEPDRHTFDARVSERDLRETYLPHFRDCVVEGKAFSVMCAYNRFMGEPCCGSSRLLNDILRREWGFQGYVVSDCWAIEDFWERHKVVASPEEAAAMAVKSGTDLNCGIAFPSLLSAAEMGLITEEEIDVSVRRLFTARMKLGLFDPPDRVPYARIPRSMNDCAKHDRLALESALKSIVLLKNDNNLLPLSKKLKTIAVIGPNAHRLDVLWGNYNGTPSHPVTPLQGIRNKVGRNTTVLYAQGCELIDGLYLESPVPSSALTTPDGQPGLLGAYFDNNEFRGEPLYTRIDEMVDFYWENGSPDKRLDDDDFGIRWSGYLTPPESGTYELGTFAFNGYRLLLEDSLLVEGYSRHHPVVRTQTVTLEKGRRYKIVMEFYAYHGESLAQLVWAKHDRPLEEEAVEVAQKADAVVLVMGLSPRLEGEEMDVDLEGFRGGDRYTLQLPKVQKHLMQVIHALGTPTVLVLLSGSALAVNWADEHIPAIIEAWYPGQRGGDAIADILFGDANPAGRLPVTFYKSLDQLSPFTDYALTGKTYRYFKGEPLYPFGYGLSYTRFHYSHLEMSHSDIQAGDTLHVSVQVENTGLLSGEEVVQLYLTDQEASVPVPVRSLKGFQRVRLKPGESRRVVFVLLPKDMSLINYFEDCVVEPGVFEVAVGGKQPGFSGHADAETTEVLTSEFRVKGYVYRLEKM